VDLEGKLAGGCENEGLGPFDFGIQPLQDRNGKGSGLASSGLGLRNDIVTLYDGDDGALLNSRRTLETG
jgi:hypothetical protein